MALFVDDKAGANAAAKLVLGGDTDHRWTDLGIDVDDQLLFDIGLVDQLWRKGGRGEDDDGRFRRSLGRWRNQERSQFGKVARQPTHQ